MFTYKLSDCTLLLSVLCMKIQGIEINDSDMIVIGKTDTYSK